MKQSKRSKLLFLLNTIMVLLLVAIPVYGFVWNNLEDKQLDVEVGTLDEINVTGGWSVDSVGKKLIPVGAIVTRADEVDELTYKIVIKNNNDEKVSVTYEVAGLGHYLKVDKPTGVIDVDNTETELILVFTLEGLDADTDFEYNDIAVTVKFGFKLED